MYSVYAIQCKENGKAYIGCTKYPEERIRQHFGQLRRHEKTVYSFKTRVISDWQKYYDQFGESSFECYLIESGIPDEGKKERESFWIEEYKSWDRKYGYNVKRGINGPAQKHSLIEGLPPKPFE